MKETSLPPAVSPPPSTSACTWSKGWRGQTPASASPHRWTIPISQRSGHEALHHAGLAVRAHGTYRGAGEEAAKPGGDRVRENPGNRQSLLRDQSVGTRALSRARRRRRDGGIGAHLRLSGPPRG